MWMTKPINVIEAMARALSIDQTALMAYRLAKGLLPLTYMNTLATRTAPITKARYGEDQNETAAKVFVMDVKSLLKKDVRLEKDKLAPYQMWGNNMTFHSVYMLPNATQLYLDTMGGLDYITDIVHGSVLNDGYDYDIEIIDDDEAEDIGGKKYCLVEDHWVEQPEETDVQANNTPSDAA